MKNKIAKITWFSLVAAALLAAPEVSRAEDSTNGLAPTNAPATKKHGVPFKGKVSAVDVNAMTFTLKTETIAVNSQTKITKDGQPAVFADITLGAMVSGSYKKDAAGKFNATSVKITTKKKQDAPPAQ